MAKTHAAGGLPPTFHDQVDVTAARKFNCRRPVSTHLRRLDPPPASGGIEN
jgi:hypothetical protein